MRQFHSNKIIPVIKKEVPPNQFALRRDVAAAELAVKAHVLAFNPEMLAETTDGARTIQEIANAVDLTESPEDAVCGLVIDLLQYCEQEKIDWTQDVMLRARKHLRRDRAYEIHNS